MIVRESPKSKGEAGSESNGAERALTLVTVKDNQPNWPPQSSVEALLSSPSGRVQAGSDGEEDEETLQLQLQAIEAKLKLKALQKKKNESLDMDRNGASSRASMATSMRRIDLSRPDSKHDNDVEVPRSPVRTRQPPTEPKSPARVMLGIDKGLTARDVSLKRPGTPGRLSRLGSSQGPGTPKIKSFSERIAESRNKEKEREVKEERAEQRRSRGFGLQNIEGIKDRPSLSRTSSDQSSRDMPPPASRTHRTPDIIRFQIFIQQLWHDPNRFKIRRDLIARRQHTDAPSFESFSGLHLKSREMQHNVVTRTLEGKTVLTIPQLLKTVKAPEYDPPEWENDYVVLGVICSKSTPHNSKNAAKDQTKGKQDKDMDQNGKFMVIRLTDLKWELDLFLFDTGFSQFWKLPLGTLVAILNPDDHPHHGIAIPATRDLDFCHAQRKDGRECGQWIDGRKTEFCEFHIQLQVDKAKKGRMQVNTMTGMGSGPGGGMFGGRRGGPKGDELKREGKYHDRELHETVYIAPRPGGAAKLIDRDHQNWEGGANREDRFPCGTMGDGGTGGDYMKLKGAGTQNLPARGYTSSQGSTGAKPDKPADTDFSSLLNRTSADVSLAPVKRKRTASAKSSTSSDPVGWGFKYGRIPSPKKEVPSAFRGTREASPAKKKARLFLDGKGIREPGRESLGGLDAGLIAAMDDDDDDLEVV
ncbi:unnamed protein product [Alternaria alternata]